MRGTAIGCSGIIFVLQFNPWIILSAAVVYIVVCCTCWLQGEQTFTSLTYFFQCFAVFFMMIIPGAFAAAFVAAVYSIFPGGERYLDQQVWGIGLGGVFYGIPGFILGSIVLAITNRSIKRQSEESL